MLVLSRKVNENVVIEIGVERVIIMVTRIEDSKVRLSFDAPKSISIDRQELWQRKQNGENHELSKNT